MFLMFHNIVHFIVQHQFADDAAAAAGSDRHGVIMPPVTAAPAAGPERH